MDFEHPPWYSNIESGRLSPSRLPPWPNELIQRRSRKNARFGSASSKHSVRYLWSSATPRDRLRKDDLSSERQVVFAKNSRGRRKLPGLWHSGGWISSHRLPRRVLPQVRRAASRVWLLRYRPRAIDLERVGKTAAGNSSENHPQACCPKVDPDSLPAGSHKAP